MKHYVYVLLDPRKPTTGQFPYEPFYVGKGSGHRATDYSTRRRHLNTGPLVNLTEGGDGSFLHTDETKSIISKANSGRKFTTEHKQKISDALKGENNPMFGKPGPRTGILHTEESKLQIGKSQKARIAKNGHCWTGRSHTEVTKKKISIARTGQMMGEDNPMYGIGGMLGKTHSEKAKAKISEALEEFRYTFQHKDGHTEETTNLTQFAKDHKVNQGNLCKVANGVQSYKSCGGWSIISKESL